MKTASRLHSTVHTSIRSTTHTWTAWTSDDDYSKKRFVQTFDISAAVGLRIQITLAVLTLFYVAALLLLSRTSFPASMHTGSHWPLLMDKPVGEDGFYMLTVADNIASKGHILYNRGAVATGIQPLATFLFALLDVGVRAFHGSDVALVRATLLFGGLLFVGFAFQMASLARALSAPAWERLAGLLTFLLVIADFTLFRLFTYGLETGVYLICIAACFRSTLGIAKVQTTSLREAAWLGIMAGFAGEARIDFGILFAGVLVGLLLKRWISPLCTLLAGGIALLIVSPWFLFLHRVSGSWMPSSGGAESTLLTPAGLGERTLFMSVAFFGHSMPWLYGVESHTTLAVGLISFFALVALARGHLLQLRQQLTPRSGSILSIWGTSMAGLFFIYFLLFDSAHFYYRYTAPMTVLWLPLLALVLASFAAVRQHLLRAAVVLPGCFSAWTLLSLHTGHVGNSQVVAAGYVREHYPTAHVGAFQSGVVGYFNRNVENLDGKLNGPALVAIKHHTMPAFLDGEHVDVLVDWPTVIHAELPAAYLQQKWQACPIPLDGTESICLQRKQP